MQHVNKRVSICIMWKMKEENYMVFFPSLLGVSCDMREIHSIVKCF